MWCAILTNLISDTIFLLLGLLIFWIVYLLTDRFQLLKFFGITKNSGIVIYISNLNVIKFGSTGFDGTPFSFQGTAIPYLESKAAARLQNLFNYFLPSRADKPGILSKLLISDINVKVVASPLMSNAIGKNASIISLGLPPYNVVSQDVENRLNPLGSFGYLHTSTDYETRAAPSGIAVGTAVPITYGPTSASTVPQTAVTSSASESAIHLPIAISSSPSKSESSKNPHILPMISITDVAPFTDTSIGFVQRLFDKENKRSVFYIAGLSENSTAGSAYYLISNWKKLHNKYGSETQFLVLLRIDNNDNQLFEVILEK